MRDDDPFHRIDDASRPDAGELLRRLPVLAVVVVIALLVLIASDGPPTDSSAAPAPRRPPSGAAASLAMAPPVVAGIDQRPLAPAPASASASASDAICGLHGVDGPLETRAAEDPHLAARIDAASHRLTAVLVNSADQRERIVGLAMSGRLAQSSPIGVVPADHDECNEDLACSTSRSTALLTRYTEALAPFTDAAARMATDSHDPFVYGIAVGLCGDIPGRPVAQACQLVSPAQWARIDPDNAQAWLHVAASAQARGDGSALDDAMRHLAVASFNRVYWDQAAGIAAAAIPADTDVFDRAQMQRAALISAALQAPPVGPVSTYCSNAALADGNRSQVCDTIAHRLVDNGSTLLERMIGTEIGRRLRWSDESIAGLRLENNAIRGALAVELEKPHPDGCETAAAYARFAENRRRYGEVGLARAAVAATGKSMAAFSADIAETNASEQLRIAASASAAEAGAASHAASSAGS